MEATDDWTIKGTSWNLIILPLPKILYISKYCAHLIAWPVIYVNFQHDLVALLLNGIRYDRLGESGSKTAGGYQVNNTIIFQPLQERLTTDSSIEYI